MDHSEVKHLPKVDHTPAELDAVSHLMLKAAALIETRGLPDGPLDEKGRGCVIVTMGECGGDHQTTEAAVTRLRPHVAFGCVISWSDKAGRDGRHEEVVAKLRAVALGG